MATGGNMWFTRDDLGIRIWIAPEDGQGRLKTGMLAGDFVVTVVEPGDTASLVPAMGESVTKPGTYNCLVTSAFLGANGVGDYGAVIEIDTFAGPSGGPHIRTVIGGMLKVYDNDFDSISASISLPTARGSMVSDGLSPDGLEIEAWLEREGEPVIAGIVSGTATLLNPDGTNVFGPTAMTLDAGTGLFRLSASAALSNTTNYILELNITDGTGAVQAYMATPTLA